MKTTLRDVVLDTPAGKKAMEEALKKSCEDQVKLLEESEEMREIKFRMVTQTTGKILGYVDIYDLLRNGSDVLPDFEEAVLEGVKFEQYTGLKDKNGKEIYEGDIVKQLMYVLEGKECITTWVVRWNNDEFCYDLHRVSGALYGDSMLSTCESEDCEVIGNIHENPESLGGEE